VLPDAVPVDLDASVESVYVDRSPNMVRRDVDWEREIVAIRRRSA
jgi:hypothetical protein